MIYNVQVYILLIQTMGTSMNTPETEQPRKRAPRNPEKRKQKIIDAAASLIAQEGSNKLTHRKVAELAGVPLGSTTQYFKSIDELRRAGLSQLAQEIEQEYNDMFLVIAENKSRNKVIADAINAYLSEPKTLRADAALYTAAIEDPEVRTITKKNFESFLARCEPYMEIEQAKILFAFVEGAVINSCFMDVPYDSHTIETAVNLILDNPQ